MTYTCTLQLGRTKIFRFGSPNSESPVLPDTTIYQHIRLGALDGLAPAVQRPIWSPDVGEVDGKCQGRDTGISPCIISFALRPFGRPDTKPVIGLLLAFGEVIGDHLETPIIQACTARLALTKVRQM